MYRENHVSDFCKDHLSDVSLQAYECGYQKAIRDLTELLVANQCPLDKLDPEDPHWVSKYHAHQADLLDKVWSWIWNNTSFE